MTDASKRELIEEAAKELHRAAWGEAIAEPADPDYMAEMRRQAVMVLTVFEQAHTPTDDEQEERRDLAERARMAANDLRNRGMEVITVWSDGATFTIQDIKRLAKAYESDFRRTAVQEPSAHDGDCEADWGSEGQESPCRCAERAQGEPTVRDHVRRLTGATDAELDELGGFQGEPTDAEVDADPDAAFELGRVAGYDEAMREVQAEPTDAIVLDEDARDVIYYALRDAGEGRATSENLSRKIITALRAALQEGDSHD